MLVSPGVYEAGGRTVNGTTTNRVALTKPVTVSDAFPDSVPLLGNDAPWSTPTAAA